MAISKTRLDTTSGHGTQGDREANWRYSSDVRRWPVVELMGEKNASPRPVEEEDEESSTAAGVFFELLWSSSLLDVDSDVDVFLRRRRSGGAPSLPPLLLL